MGGGQLGRMFVHAAQRLGYATAVLDPDADSPAGRVSHHHVRAGYSTRPAWPGWPKPGRRHHHRVRERAGGGAQHAGAPASLSPGAAAVAIAQDRAPEKSPLPALRRALRAARGHRDARAARGRGRRPAARHPEDRAPGLRRQGPGARGHAGRTGAGLGRHEGRALRARETAAAAARMLGGRGARRRRRHGAPAGAAQPAPRRHPGRHRGRRGRGARRRVRDAGHRATRAIAQGLDYVGVLCVEFFVLQDGSLVVNEMAPRPHNSGHWSIDGADVSQFDLQVRTLAGLPLVAPRQHSHAVMLNLLGDLWFAGGSERDPALGARARAHRRQPAPVRQAAGAARPQDGPPDHHRRDRTRRADHRPGSLRGAGHRPF
jgi:5-(carboxyamino)imidazole ribonucleotide synthase